MKFKVGDKVKYLGGSVWGNSDKLKKGQIYTVFYVDDNSIKVKEGSKRLYIEHEYFKKVDIDDLSDRKFKITRICK